jgi:hypothetical protein
MIDGRSARHELSAGELVMAWRAGVTARQQATAPCDAVPTEHVRASSQRRTVAPHGAHQTDAPGKLTIDSAACGDPIVARDVHRRRMDPSAERRRAGGSDARSRSRGSEGSGAAQTMLFAWGIGLIVGGRSQRLLTRAPSVIATDDHHHHQTPPHQPLKETLCTRS